MNLDEPNARILAQQIQITRLHSALVRARSNLDQGRFSDTDLHLADIDAALASCEADAGQIAADVREVLDGGLFPAALDEALAGAIARLRALFGAG